MIAKSAIKEHSRRKLILIAVVVSLLTMAVLLYFAVTGDQTDVLFGPPTRGASGATIASFASLGFLGLFALFIALAVSMSNVGQPFSSGEATLVLARPVARWQYALGRLAASVAIVIGFCALLAVEMQIVSIVGGSRMSGDLWQHWGAEAFNLSVVAAITTLLSTFVSIPIVVAVISFFVNQVVGGLTFLHGGVRADVIKGFVATVVEALWYVTPKYIQSGLSRRGSTVSTVEGSSADEIVRAFNNSTGMTIWAVAYLMGIVVVIVLLVKRKEI